jgi:hypothetical protein
MGKSMKIRISMILAVLIIIQYSTAFAAETNSIVEYDLQTAIASALENSSSLKLADEKIQNARDICYYYNALSATAKTSATDVKLGPTNDLYLIENVKARELYPRQKENDLTNLINEKQDKIVSLKLDVTEKYFTLLSAGKQITYQQGLLDRLDADLKIKKNDVNIGRSTASAVTEVQLKIKQANSRMVQLKRDKEKMEMSLNSLLGKPINAQIKIKEMDIPKTVYDNSNIDATIADRQKNNATIKDILYKISEAKLEIEIVKGNTKREDPTELDALEVTQLSQEYALKDEMVNIEKYIRQENNTILNLIDEIEIKSLSNEICQKNLKVAQEKLNLGVLSQADINTVINAAEQASVDSLKAQLNYYLEVQRFNAYLEKQ